MSEAQNAQARNELLEQLRRHCIVDPDDAEEMLNLEDDLEAAESYMLGSGVPVSSDPLRLLLLRKLAIYYHESVGPDRQYGYPDPPPDLNALILNLRY